MEKLTNKAILSAKDSIKNANVKLTKLAQDMVAPNGAAPAPSPEQVKEMVESIVAVGEEIVEGLEQVTNGEPTPDPVPDPTSDHIPTPVVANIDEDTKKKMDAQDDEIKDLKKFKEDSEKEKMASEYGNLFPANQKDAKVQEFMKMDRPNSELRTVLSATENVLTSLTKNASMRKSNETIIFKETNQKNASMGEFTGHARGLSEI